MPESRYFLDSPFKPHAKATLEDEEFHHLSRVMRGNVGDEIELVNGQGQLATARIEKIDKREAQLAIMNVATHTRSWPPLILAQAIPRLNRLEFILEKGTELGVSEFWLFPGKHSEKESFSQQQQRRMRMLIIAAMKQCGRFDLPKIEMKTLQECRADGEAQTFYGDVREGRPQLPVLDPKRPIIFYVGPEAGFHADEVEMLESYAVGVSLHPNILRVDTAAIAALSQLSLRIGF